MAYENYKDPEARREYMRQWRAANRERFLAAMKRWREANPEKVKKHNATWWRENSEQHYTNGKRWRDANPDKLRELNRRHRTANPAKVREAIRRWEDAHPNSVKLRHKKWEEANPEKLLAKWRRRRARELHAPGEFTAEDWEVLVALSPRCHWCKKPFNKARQPTHDHVIPLSKGGANTVQNSVCACGSCNSRKGARRSDPITGQGLLL